MSVESRINKAIDEMSESYGNTLARKSNEAMRAFSQSRLTVFDILAKHTDEHGKIPKSSIAQVTNELTQIDGLMYRDLRNYLRNVAYRDSEESIISLLDVLIAAVGVVALAEILGIPKDVVDRGIDASIIAMYLAGVSVTTSASSLVDSMFNRKGDDGLNLYDRLRRVSISFRREIEREIREGVRKESQTSEITQNIQRKVSDFKWRIDSIVETEFMYVQRSAIGKLAEYGEKVGLVVGLKIVDYPHGTFAEHARHRCFIYARANEHGLGRGVYPVSTRKIRNPHPRCRSTLHFVMTDRFK